MKKRNSVFERIVTIVAGIVLGLIVSYFIRDWNEVGVMKTTQWAALIGVFALSIEQINSNICRLACSFLLATLVGSMIGVTIALGITTIITLATASVVILAIMILVIIKRRSLVEEELWGRINAMTRSSKNPNEASENLSDVEE